MDTFGDVLREKLVRINRAWRLEGFNTRAARLNVLAPMLVDLALDLDGDDHRHLDSFAIFLLHVEEDRELLDLA